MHNKLFKFDKFLTVNHFHRSPSSSDKPHNQMDRRDKRQANGRVVRSCLSQEEWQFVTAAPLPAFLLHLYLNGFDGGERAIRDFRKCPVEKILTYCRLSLLISPKRDVKSMQMLVFFYAPGVYTVVTLLSCISSPPFGHWSCIFNDTFYY